MKRKIRSDKGTIFTVVKCFNCLKKFRLYFFNIFEKSDFCIDRANDYQGAYLCKKCIELDDDNIEYDSENDFSMEEF